MVTDKQVEAALRSFFDVSDDALAVIIKDGALARMRRALIAAEAAAWEPIKSAPKDGTVIDIYDGTYRWPDCYWGKPHHCCGEQQQYCDDDWHREPEGWVYAPLNQPIEITSGFWRPIQERWELEPATQPPKETT